MALHTRGLVRQHFNSDFTYLSTDERGYLKFTDFFQDAFILLLKELREKFNQHGYLLSAAVASAESSASLSYNIPELGR
jgi:hypothetical protein